MVKLKLVGSDELMGRIQAMGSGADGLIKRMLKAGGEIVVKSTAAALAEATLSYTPACKMRRTGALGESLKAGNLVISGADSSISVWPHDSRVDKAHKKPTANATIGFVFEQGKKHQRARPFMAPAADASAAEVHDLWERMVREHVEASGK